MALHSQLDQIINAMLPFVQKFHSQGQLAPHAASLSRSGELIGATLATNDNRRVSVPDTLAHFENQFRQAANADQIIASAVFYHGVGLTTLGTPAQTVEEAGAIVGMLEHKAGDSVYLVIPYHDTDAGIEYELGRLITKPASVFLPR